MQIKKAELEKLLVEERKKMRDKQKQSDFMSKSRNTYNGQKARALEDFKVELPYSLDEFREWLRPFVDTTCSCGKKITIKQMAVDHHYPVSRGGSWALDNLSVLCRSCNFRKGKLLPDEYSKLVEFANTYLSPESRADLWQRLATGGKFHNGE